VQIRRYTASDRDAIERLNGRLAAGGAVDRVYPEGAEQERAGQIRERLFVAADEGEIRGGVWLREQPFRVRGQDVGCGWLKYPVAESLVDARFNAVPGSLLIQCLREQPRLMALGLGGHETPLARMLARLRWTGMTVPMLFRFVRPARALRRLGPMRASRARRLAADVLAASGAAWVGQRLWDAANAVRRGRVSACQVREEPALGPWADEIWRRVRDDYGLIAERDHVTVDAALPKTADVRRLRVLRDGADIGWVCVVRHDFSAAPDARFGDLTVGLIADCVASPRDGIAVASCAFDYLRDSGADVVFSNQLHPAWLNALRSIAFLNGPSNFAFYASPAMAALGVDWRHDAQINRGDCDGPVWYRTS